MNIFYIHPKADICAQHHVDKHVIKMIVEYAQILSTAHRMIDGREVILYKESLKTGKFRKKKIWEIGDDRDTILYAATHVNHPSMKWARASSRHYEWLYQLFDKLHSEYQHRYGANKVHKTYDKLAAVLKRPPVNLGDNGWKDPFQAMPDDINTGSSLTDYRMYYIRDKKRMHKWTNRIPPDWLHTPISNTDMEITHEIDRLSGKPRSIRGT